MILARIEDNTFLYKSFELFYKDTFNPDLDYDFCVLKVTGKTYKEKKDNFRNLLHNIYLLDVGGLSWAKINILQCFVEKQAKRY